MKPFVRTIGCILLVLMASMSHAAAANEKTEESVIRGLMQQWLTAYNKKDIDALMSLYSEEIYYANNGNKLARSKSAIRRSYEPQFKSAPNVIIDFSEEITSVGQSLAHVAGKYRVNVPQADNKVSHAYGRVLLIFEKENGQWKLIVDFDNTGNDISATDFQNN